MIQSMVREGDHEYGTCIVRDEHTQKLDSRKALWIIHER